jgi:hypothetical protein
MQTFRFLLSCFIFLGLQVVWICSNVHAVEASVAATADESSPSDATVPVVADTLAEEEVEEEPWDYSPYRVHIWITSNDQRASAASLTSSLRAFLDRPFASVWRVGIGDAPSAVSAGAVRNFNAMTYDSITSADTVLAVKRDHPEAVRIRVAADVAQYVKKCLSTPDRLAEIKRRGAAIGNPTLDGIAPIMSEIDGDSLAVSERWKDPQTEALLLSRGMASLLRQPEAKIIRVPVDDLVAEAVLEHDKIFVVRIDGDSMPMKVEVAELDCLMRQFSPIVTREALNFATLSSVVGQAIIDAFGPVVRIEDAGQKDAVGLVRAAGLIIDENNPALIKAGEFLQPMVRKDDRNGSPIAIGPIPWAYLHVKKAEGARVEMDFYSGQSGGLQGRKNSRTFRMALRTRPVGESTTLRLRTQGPDGEPLVGYEVYEKELDSIDMTFVGRTNWDGRLNLEKTDAAMRLLYVKNGGAVLARLPVVPGLKPIEVADLTGDDQRLRAEAYIRGTQNAIVDLIAIRKLLAARIRLRLSKGQLAEAKELLTALRDQPTYDTIANDMGKKAIQIKGRNVNEQRKIDMMFAETREMLVNNINSKLLRDLEADVAKAEASPEAAGS